MKKLLIVFVLCRAGGLFGAHQPVIGLVLDAETSEPLPFTNVVITGQVKGTVANAEGVYVLDLSDIEPGDSISFRHMGYETLTFSAAQLKRQAQIRLKPATINLNEVAIYSKDLTPEGIIEKVRENYKKNYPEATDKQRVFLHTYEKATFPLKDQVVLKKSDFVGFDRKLFGELVQKIPEEFIEYHDVLLEVYYHEKERKLVPVEGVSLEEGSIKELSKELENKLSAFMEDIEKTKENEDTYYKFRTGIFAFDADMHSEASTADSLTNHQEEDTLHHTMSAGQMQGTIVFLENEYASPESDNWEFINKTRKYRYTLGETTTYNDELVYQIAFKPKSGGLFEGIMYVSAATFAILQLDFAYAGDKSSENIQLLGFGHSMDYKKGRVIFERGKDGYYIKYIYAEQREVASIDRNFSFMKKEKRFLWDKTLSEMKFDLELTFNIQTNWELLVMDRSTISQEQYSQIEQPESMKLKKEYAYSPEMWENSTVIAPTAELKKYERKE